MTLQEVGLIFKKEILGFIRDRNILIYSLVLPIFLYPITFWVMNQIILFQRGSVEEQVSKVALVNAGYALDLYDLLLQKNSIDVQLGEGAVSEKGVDAVLSIDDVFNGAGGPCFKMSITYDKAMESSEIARMRLIDILDEFKDTMMGNLARDMGLPLEMVQPYEIELENVASGKKMGTYIIGRLLPFMIIIMAAMGTLYPAIDVIVGERERNTFETTMLLPCSRISIIMGKFAAVILAGMVAVFLNMFSLAVTASHTLFLLDEDKQTVFNVPLHAFPLIFFATFLIAAGFGAASIVLASYAKTFREGQSFVSPFFAFGIQPAVVSALPGIKLTTGIAFIPIANVSLMFREAIDGIYQWDKIIIVLSSLILYCAVLLVIAANRLRSETTFLGAAEEGGSESGKRNWLSRLRRSR